jgi:hypothetical protein
MQFGLPLSVTPEGVRTQIDFVTLVINPVDRVAVFTKIHFLEVRPSLEMSKNFSLREERPKINNAFIAIIPDDFENAMDDWTDGNHSWKRFAQSILPISSLAVAAAHVANNIAW